MDIKVLKQDKDSIELEIESLTIAELLRVYLNKDSSVSFAAWKREHPSKNPVLVIQTQGKDAKKVLLDTIDKIKKLNSSIASDFKKTFK